MTLGGRQKEATAGEVGEAEPRGDAIAALEEGKEKEEAQPGSITRSSALEAAENARRLGDE